MGCFSEQKNVQIDGSSAGTRGVQGRGLVGCVKLDDKRDVSNRGKGQSLPPITNHTYTPPIMNGTVPAFTGGSTD